MVKSADLDMVYRFFLAYRGNPRIKKRQLHLEYSNYKSKRATSRFLELITQKEMIKGPYLYCNSGFTVEVFKDDRNLSDLLDEVEKTPSITYAVALCGDYSFLKISRGASTLQYTETVTPSYPAKKSIHEISFEERGNLPVDPYPHRWDEIDWKVYEYMRCPDISFPLVASKVGVSWKTVQRSYEKILKDCKILMSFFPLGYHGYQHQLVTFETKYETGVREALKMLDRTTYLYKFNDIILLILFTENFNSTSRNLRVLEENGLIHSLRVSIPTEYYSSMP